MVELDTSEFRMPESEVDEFHHKATRTLFIGNLDRTVTKDVLRDTFNKFGLIVVSVGFVSCYWLLLVLLSSRKVLVLKNPQGPICILQVLVIVLEPQVFVLVLELQVLVLVLVLGLEVLVLGPQVFVIVLELQVLLLVLVLGLEVLVLGPQVLVLVTPILHLAVMS